MDKVEDWSRQARRAATRILTLPSRSGVEIPAPKVAVARTLTGPLLMNARPHDRLLTDDRFVTLSRGMRRVPPLVKSRSSSGGVTRYATRPPPPAPVSMSYIDDITQAHARHASVPRGSGSASAPIPVVVSGHRRYATRGSATSDGSSSHTATAQKLPGHLAERKPGRVLPLLEPTHRQAIIKAPAPNRLTTHRGLVPPTPLLLYPPAAAARPVSPRVATLLNPKRVYPRNSNACRLVSPTGPKTRTLSVTPRPFVGDQLVPNSFRRLRSQSENFLLDFSLTSARRLDPNNFSNSLLETARRKPPQIPPSLSLSPASSSPISSAADQEEEEEIISDSDYHHEDEYEEEEEVSSSDEVFANIARAALPSKSPVPKLQLPVGLPSAFTNLRPADLSASSFSHSPSSPVAGGGRWKFSGNRIARRMLEACSQKPRRLQRRATIGLPIRTNDTIGSRSSGFDVKSLYLPIFPSDMTSRQTSMWSLNDNFSSLINHMCSMRSSDIISSAVCATLLVAWMKDKGIKGLAIDFDNTLSQIHSNGYVDLDTVKRRFWQSIAPDAALLCQEAANHGMKLSCVTFSDPASIVRQSHSCIAGQQLIEAFVERSGQNFRFDHIVGYYPRLHGVKGLVSKNEHLERFGSEFNLGKSEILLVDDDLYNVKEAVRVGYLGLHVKGGRGFSFKSMGTVMMKGV